MSGWTRTMRSVSSRSAWNTRNQHGLMVTAVALAVVLGLQSERVFIATMIFDVDQSNRTELARNAVLVFLSIVLAAPIMQAAGARAAMAVGALLLAGSRVIVQFSDGPALRWQVAALGITGLGWFLIGAVSTDREPLGAGIGIGLWLDLVIRAWFDTIDLPFMAGASQDLLTVALILALIVSLVAARRTAVPADTSTLDAMPLIGIGAGITCYALIGGNLGLAGVRTGGDLQYSLWLLSLGPVVALMLWHFPLRSAMPATQRSSPIPFTALAAGVALIAGYLVVALPASNHRVAAVGLMLFGFGAVYLTMLATRCRSYPPAGQIIWRGAIFLTIGMLAHAAMIFLYFSSSGSAIYPAIAVAMLAASGLFAAWRTVPIAGTRNYRDLAPFAGAAAWFLLALMATSAEIPGGSAGALDEEFTVVTYNIQNGFSRDNRLDLEGIATTIERLEPDVVLLQESGRGWYAVGWTDQIWWLSQRLEMVAAFGPASHDDLWGNAILSRTPLSQVDVHQYRSTQNLHRAVISAVVPLGEDELWVASTHLDNPRNAQQVRLDQAGQVLEQWGGRTPAIIGGDFNASPDTDVVALVLEAGFEDTAGVAGNAETTSEGGRKIDYVFVTPDLATVSVTIPDVWTSDHRPLAVTIRRE